MRISSTVYPAATCKRVGLPRTLKACMGRWSRSIGGKSGAPKITLPTSTRKRASLPDALRDCVVKGPESLGCSTPEPSPSPGLGGWFAQHSIGPQERKRGKSEA